eukprot:gene385-biopygen9437
MYSPWRDTVPLVAHSALTRGSYDWQEALEGLDNHLSFNFLDGRSTGRTQRRSGQFDDRNARKSPMFPRVPTESAWRSALQAAAQTAGARINIFKEAYVERSANHIPRHVICGRLGVRRMRELRQHLQAAVSCLTGSYTCESTPGMCPRPPPMRIPLRALPSHPAFARTKSAPPNRRAAKANIAATSASFVISARTHAADPRHGPAAAAAELNGSGNEGGLPRPTPLANALLLEPASPFRRTLTCSPAESAGPYRRAIRSPRPPPAQKVRCDAFQRARCSMA